jgi:hypothetical protein
MKGVTKVELFDRMCKEQREIVQEMAKDGQILCLKNHIEFKPEFLIEIGYKPKES